jgi:hypothetical protein
MTNYPGNESTIVHLDSEKRNNAGTIAHELLHAIGIHDHVSEDQAFESELMLWYPDSPDEVKDFGAPTAKLYEEQFDVGPDVSNAVVVFDGPGESP